MRNNLYLTTVAMRNNLYLTTVTMRNIFIHNNDYYAK